MSEISDYLPGRLGRNDATLETDERADPRIVQVLLAARGLAPEWMKSIPKQFTKTV